jgi:hypothetical protein
LLTFHRRESPAALLRVCIGDGAGKLIPVRAGKAGTGMNDPVRMLLRDRICNSQLAERLKTPEPDS